MNLVCWLDHWLPRPGLGTAGVRECNVNIDPCPRGCRDAICQRNSSAVAGSGSLPTTAAVTGIWCLVDPTLGTTPASPQRADEGLPTSGFKHFATYPLQVLFHPLEALTHNKVSLVDRGLL